MTCVMWSWFHQILRTARFIVQENKTLIAEKIT